MLSGLEQEFWLDHICTLSKKLNCSVLYLTSLICTTVVRIK